MPTSSGRLRIRALLVNLGVVLLTLALLAGAGEVTLRLWPAEGIGHENPDGTMWYRFNPYVTDGVLSYALRPNWDTIETHRGHYIHVRTNALGLRGGPASPQKAKGVLRLLVVGDSFAFGYGVDEEDTFASRLGPMLTARLGRPVEVLNAGVPGWSADDYLLYLRTRGFSLHPDAVLLAVMENDVADLLWKRVDLDAERLPVRTRSMLRVIDEDGRMRYVQKGATALRDPPFPDWPWLAEHSALYNWLRYRVMRAWYARDEERAGEERESEAGPPPTGAIDQMSPQEVQRGLASGDAFRLRYHRYLVSAIESDAARRGVGLFVLTIAHRDSHPAPGSAIAGLHVDCAKLGRRCLDTLGMFPSGHQDDFFLVGDGHWNARGHARVADAVADWLAPQLATRPGQGEARTPREAPATGEGG